MILTEIKGADFAEGFSRMKKTRAAAQAENAATGTGWLPALLRPVVAAAAPDDTDAEHADEVPNAAE